MREWFKCYHPNCDKVYNSKYNLVRHINTNHLLILKYHCPHCERKFPHKQNLGYHLKAHYRAQRNSGALMAAPLEANPVPQESLAVMLQQSKLPPIDLSRKMVQQHQKVPIIPTLITESFFTE